MNPFPTVSQIRDVRHLADLFGPATIARLAGVPLRNVFRITGEEYSKAEDRGDVVAMTIWGRTNENARKLALLYACSENHKEPEISIPATRWASDFMPHQIRRQLCKAKEYSSKTRFQALCKDALHQLKQWHHRHGKKGMPYWVLRRQLGIMPREFADLLLELEAQRFIKTERIPTKGRPQETISLLKIEK